MAIAGRVAIVPKGEWSADAAYKRLDAVTYNNTLYFAKKEVPAGTATSNTEYWSKSIAGGVGSIATTENAGIVKPDGRTITIDEDGTIHGQSETTVDGTTITIDEARGIISLAKTLQDKIKTIDNKLPKTSVVNTNTTTEAGFALDARQANPNIEGTMAANILQLNNDFTQRLGFGHNYSFMQVPENCGDSGILQRLCVTDATLLFESWKNNIRQKVINLTDVLYYNLDNSFNVPVTETDICYATKVGLTVELKLTVRFTDVVAGGVTIMTLPKEIRPAYYQKCAILSVLDDNSLAISTVAILPNGIVASDNGFRSGKWNFIQLSYHTNYTSG